MIGVCKRIIAIKNDGKDIATIEKISAVLSNIPLFITAAIDHRNENKREKNIELIAKVKVSGSLEAITSFTSNPETVTPQLKEKNEEMYLIYPEINPTESEWAFLYLAKSASLASSDIITDKLSPRE